MTQEKIPVVSIIIATRDRSEMLESCLRHVVEQDYPHYEIVIVDNSVDNLTASVVSKFPISSYIRENPNTDNLSFLRNIGIDHSRGEILAFLDDDSIVQTGWLSNIIRAFADQTVGGVTGRVIDDTWPEDNSPVIGRLSPREDMTGTFNNHYPDIVDVDYLFGCNMTFRREALEQVGGFDTWMHYAREDQEMSLRVKKAGYRLIFHPGVVVQHLHAPRSRGAIQRNASANYRSRVMQCRALSYQYVKHYGLRWDFAKLAFWQLPKGDLSGFFSTPALTLLPFLPLTLIGIIWGYILAGLAALRLHSAPTVGPVIR